MELNDYAQVKTVLKELQPERARGIKTKDDFIDLLVADQLKARMSLEAHIYSYVILKEDRSWHRAPELSRLMGL
ncbi:hypothetical protein HPB47_013249 [Ixodes persulcatus]|uniref:Uncharacterized protein n=1 Tax=Ixodes persulcatus TaxID=34615 RepID=A0AC60R1L4_IXOPE|nr:hypothetical protein HPB47_013249 [Ixodes persulcatus]